MLKSLFIKNFAIVSHLDLDFENKMSVFTGETGAGKSIMIDALMLALGERADASIVRKDAEKCEIQAIFSSNSATDEWLHNNDAKPDGNEISLRRVIYLEGRSKSYINGIPFNLQKIKELSEMLVDIHGQHQHQTLLNHQTHRHQLDAFAGHTDLLNATQKYYQTCQILKQQINSLDIQQNDPEKTTLLQYQIDELERLELLDGEIDMLHNEHKLLHHAKEYLENIQALMLMLRGEEGPNVISLLNNILQLLQSLPANNLEITSTNELINNALIQCEEAYNEINRFAEKIQIDPERLTSIETRMSELHHIARKYHIDVNQLDNKIKELQAKQIALNENQKLKAKLIAELNEAENLYQKYASKLRESRHQHALKLSSKITAVIRNLGMPKGYIEIELTSQEKMHAHGLDKVEYKVCTNPGMHPESLAKIISGGELSRISLAIQVITAQHSATPTLFFDEVDVGIGGATAALVGKLLRNLGERLQIFCVTHQPQVAASAHQHFKVTKQIKSGQTYTNIQKLDQTAKINEIARMLGGIEITLQTKKHAEEMLEISHNLETT